MISLLFPDGARREFPDGATGADVAAAISKSLAKRAVAAKVDGTVRDLSAPVPDGATVEILTREAPDALPLIRHDAAHVMAEAVQALFPGTQAAIGPVVENGFYYDFDRPEPFRPDDLPLIEAKMREIVARNSPITCETWSREEARAHFAAKGEGYKVELVDAIPDGEALRVYRQGEWLDLCRGPHGASTGGIGTAFKLTRLAGAYWRGDSNNRMLQRIYATAWASDVDLKAYLHRLEEADRRDHRRLAKEMDLFHLQEEAPGMVFWHPAGWTMWRALEDYMRRRLNAAGYREIRTPQVVDRALWERSGHWDAYRENMFIVEVDEEGAREKRNNALKPMNCPCHVQVYNQGITSYRELPIRLAEFGSCHRYESSGSMHGLMRVRGFTQDDAHIFCTEGQIEAECAGFLALLSSVYRDLGFDRFDIKLSTRPPVRVGSDETWDRAEAALAGAIEKAGYAYEIAAGDGAFYGPKLDFKLTDAIGREWQCGTFQADFNLPVRLGAEYVGEDGAKRPPVMLHRAILGSFERFLGILMENYAGHFPLWLAPTQAVVATITGDADGYAAEVAAALRAAGLRSEADLRNEKINYKVREHSLAKVPVMLVVGRREAEERTVSIRRLGSKDQTGETLDDAVAALRAEALPPDLRG